jgi:hypothetical protein
MPKAERGTPKDIANRIKAKGLQKLRWYCQMVYFVIWSKLFIVSKTMS